MGFLRMRKALCFLPLPQCAYDEDHGLELQGMGNSKVVKYVKLLLDSQDVDAICFLKTKTRNDNKLLNI